MVDQSEEINNDWAYMNIDDKKHLEYFGKIDDPLNLYPTFTIIGGLEDGSK